MRFVLLLFFLLPLIAAEDGGKLTLRDGSSVAVTGKIEQQWNMLALPTARGKMLVSQNLVNWEDSYYDWPELVKQFQPEIAARMEKRHQSKAYAKPDQPVAITNKSLAGLKPGVGIVNKWEPQGDMDRAMAEIAKEKGQDGGRKAAASGPSVKTITHGDKVNLSDHLDSDRFVVFDFYADWCGPCRQLTPRLEALVKKHPDKLVLRKIDIVRWGTPVAQQFGVNSIPYLEVYDPNGKKVHSGTGFKVLSQLESMASKW